MTEKWSRAVLRGLGSSNALRLPDNIRHYPAPQTARTGWKLLIKPSKDSVREVRKKLQVLWRSLHGSNVQRVLKTLNPVIRGWANYFRIAVAKEIFHTLDEWMRYKADHHTRYTHPTKSADWRYRTYWGRFNPDREDSWVFGDKRTGAYLLKFSWFPIERHALVKGTSSPDDPRLTDYWMKRQAAKTKDLTPSKQQLAKRQQGRCPACGESLFNEEDTEVHHLLARSCGGRHTYSNLALVHMFCHQQLHAQTQRVGNHNHPPATR